jgi:hypothetical protein
MSMCVNQPTSPEPMMRVLTISGPGVATDDECCPHGQVLLKQQEGYHGWGLCHVDTR